MLPSIWGSASLSQHGEHHPWLLAERQASYKILLPRADDVFCCMYSEGNAAILFPLPSAFIC